MKHLNILIAFFASGLLALHGQLNESRGLAIGRAADQAATSLAATDLGGKAVALMPLRGDAGKEALGRIKNGLTAAGVTVVEGKDEPAFAALITEIDWDARKEDILDEATLVKLDARTLKGAGVLLYGTVRTSALAENGIYAEVELHAVEVATRVHAWGGVFVGRDYLGADMQGIVEWDATLRELLREDLATMADALNAPEVAAKLEKLGTVAVVPVAGDRDQYVTGLAIEALTATRMKPVAARFPTVSEARRLQQLGQFPQHAMLYGAIRGLYKREMPANDTLAEKAWFYSVEVQFFLEDAATGAILWSKSLLATRLAMEKKVLSTKEKAVVETVEAVKGSGRPVLYFLGAVGLIIALGVAIAIVRSATNVR